MHINIRKTYIMCIYITVHNNSIVDLSLSVKIIGWTSKATTSIYIYAPVFDTINQVSSQIKYSVGLERG